MLRREGGGAGGVLSYDKKGKGYGMLRGQDGSRPKLSSEVPRNWIEQSHPQHGLTVTTIWCSEEASVRGLAAGAEADSDVDNISQR